MLIIAAAVTIGGTVGYMAGRHTSNVELRQLVRSSVIVCSAKETVYYTRLLEGLRDGKTDLVIDRLETMLDHSVVNIGIETEFGGPPQDVDDALSRSLCVARNYRAQYPHRPSDDWLAKRYNAALALKTEHN